ncbi:MAG: hypothetical protein M2R45_03695 [Verrucomicrobia subdivision 3 bacterium]|nr:hypothetical protein [Limisphaerales bacterium]MCS1414978.1 hypothetical protein [Limisphaerales bacterium]
MKPIFQKTPGAKTAIERPTCTSFSVRLPRPILSELEAADDGVRRLRLLRQRGQCPGIFAQGDCNS